MKKDPTRKMTDQLSDSERVRGIYLAMKQGDEALALNLLTGVKGKSELRVRVISITRRPEDGEWVSCDIDGKDRVIQATN